MDLPDRDSLFRYVDHARSLRRSTVIIPPQPNVSTLAETIHVGAKKVKENPAVCRSFRAFLRSQTIDPI